MYEGQYSNDKKEGFGIFKWISGNVYIGHYKNDERDGIGQMIWIDGSMYIGQWRSGVQHEYGRMYFADGTIKEGLFDKNIFKGTQNLDMSAVPKELLNKNFEIIKYAKDLPFNEETLNKKQLNRSHPARSFGIDFKETGRNWNIGNKWIQTTKAQDKKFAIVSKRDSDKDIYTNKVFKQSIKEKPKKRNRCCLKKLSTKNE